MISAFQNELQRMFHTMLVNGSTREQTLCFLAKLLNTNQGRTMIQVG